jgi:hypothetical protein
MKPLLGILALALLIGCNPVKRAMKRKAEIDKAIAEYVLENPVPYSEIVKPGDTILLTDTMYLPLVLFDTLRVKDTIKITMERWKQITNTLLKTDTLIRVENNEKAIRQLMNHQASLDMQLAAANKKSETLLWWLIAMIVAVIVSILALIRR